MMVASKCSSNSSFSAKVLAKLFLGSLAFLFLGCVSTLGQGNHLAVSGTVENALVLTFKLRSLAYRQSDKVIIRYSVENKTNQNVCLIIDEPLVPGYDIEKKELSGDLSKIIVGYDFFEPPKLKLIRRKKQYQGQVSLSLDVLRGKFVATDWYLYLSVGYVDSRGMAEIRTERRRFPMGTSPLLFEKVQKVIQAGPIKLKLVN